MEEVTADQDVRLLARFVLRARRVLDSRIARQIDIPATVPQQQQPSGPSLGIALLDEESVDAAGARVRPMLLSSDELHWEKVLGALERALSDVDSARRDETLGQLRELWEAVRKPPRPREGPFSDRQLADRFLYGDLVHADELPSDIPSFPFRLFAAQAYVIDAIQATSATLQIVQQANAAGLIRLPQRCWTDAVSADGQRTAYYPLQSLSTAPVGTPLPQDFEDLPPQWTTVHPPDTETKTGKASS